MPSLRFDPGACPNRSWRILHGCRSCSPFSIVAHIALSLLSDSEIDVPQNEKSGENPDQRGNFTKFANSDFDHRIGD
jgi:hypothetical protein